MASWRCLNSPSPKVTLKVKTMIKLRFLIDIGDVSSALALLDAAMDRQEQEYYSALRKELYNRKRLGSFSDWGAYCRMKEQIEDLLL